MPNKPLSHEQRRRQNRLPQDRKEQDQRYERERRQTSPELSAAQKFRSSARWQRLRELCLNRSPLCQDPYGVHARDNRPEAATDVDHIVAITVAPGRAGDLSNLQSLCRSCHARKSGQERSGKLPEVNAEEPESPDAPEAEEESSEEIER